MIILIIIVIVLLVIGIWVVIRSGVREIILDEEDQKLGDETPSEQFQMLPHLKSEPPKEGDESWTLDSTEDASSGKAS